MHAASSLEAPEEVVAWREALEAPPPDAACGEQFIPIEPLSDAAIPRDTIEEVVRSEEHTSELQSPDHLVCRLLLEKKKINTTDSIVQAHPQSIVGRVQFVVTVFLNDG